MTPAQAKEENNFLNVTWENDTPITKNILFEVGSVIPGAKNEAVIKIKNKSKHTGKIKASITDFTVNNTPQESKVAPEFQTTLDEYLRDFTVNDKPAKELIEKDFIIHNAELQSNNEETIKVFYNLPYSSKSGNAADIGKTTISFTVNVNISGEDNSDNKGKETSDGKKNSTTVKKPQTDTKSETNNVSEKSKLGATGAQVVLYALLSIILTLIGLILAKKRKTQEE